MKTLATISLAALVLSSCDSSTTPGPTGGWFSDFADSGTEVRLHFDEDTFAESMEVTLDASDSGAAIDPDAFEDYTGTRPITHPAVARFSQVAVAGDGEQIDFWVEVPEAAIQEAEQAGRTIHGMIRLSGDDLPGPDPEALQPWHWALGPLVRSETGQVFLRLKLFAAAREVYALAVSSPRYRFITDADLSRNTKRRQGDHVFDVPWVIACHGDFDDPGVCDPDPESAGEGRLALWEAQEAAAWLKGKGFDRARFMAVPHSEAVRFAEDELDGSLISESAADPNDPVVHIARLVPQYPCSTEVDASGCYNVASGDLSIALEAVGTSSGDGTGLANVYVHEMTHGIQAAMFEYVFYERDPGTVRWSWLYEGTADALAYWNQVPEPANLMQVRNRGHWHPFDVDHPLNHSGEQYPYFAAEFFMALDSGDMTYIPGFFERIDNLGAHTTSYDAVDQAIDAELGSGPLDYLLALTAPASNLLLAESLQQEHPLGLGFLRMMTERTPSKGFPHCDQSVYVVGIPEEPLVWETIESATAPFSSLCWNVEVLDYETEYPGSCLKFSLIPGEDPDSGRRLVIMLDGGKIHNQDDDPQTIAYAQDSLFIQGGTGTVQLIDLDLERGERLPTDNRFESLIDIEVDPTCGASQEEIARCFDTRVICDDDTCYLEMTPGDPPDCWVDVGMCVKDGGCYHMQWGDWAPASFGVCGATESLMRSFQPPGEFVIFEDAKVPAHGRCGDADFCSRIILCAD